MTTRSFQQTEPKPITMRLADETVLEGDLSLPESPVGLIVFAHGSGSSRMSPRNQFVAQVLNEGGLGTLLFDLLTPQEHEIDRRTRELRFDIDLLARRQTAAVDWASGQERLSSLPIGLFGASTGAAAALGAAAERPEVVGGVVSRGGRPDLAADALPNVQAPTLLIVGGNDREVIGLNKQAIQDMRCERRIEIVPGATHLFEEEGKLERVAELARNWFREKLAAGFREPSRRVP